MPPVIYCSQNAIDEKHPCTQQRTEQGKKYFPINKNCNDQETCKGNVEFKMVANFEGGDVRNQKGGQAS